MMSVSSVWVECKGRCDGATVSNYKTKRAGTLMHSTIQ
jgi:hypothetical protein